MSISLEYYDFLRDLSSKCLCKSNQSSVHQYYVAFNWNELFDSLQSRNLSELGATFPIISSSCITPHIAYDIRSAHCNVTETRILVITMDYLLANLLKVVYCWVLHYYHNSRKL